MPVMTDLPLTLSSDKNVTTNDACHTTSRPATSIHGSTVLLLDVAYIVMGIVGTGLNLFACIVMTRYQPMTKRLHNYFLLNQTILDLVVGAMQVINIALLRMKATGLSLYVWCYVVQSRVAFNGPMLASTWNLAGLSVERYMEIVHPIRHKMLVTRRKVCAAMICAWLFGIGFKVVAVLPVIHIVNDVCIPAHTTEAQVFAIILLHSGFEFFIPVGISSFCYVAMFRTVRCVKFSSSMSQMSKASKNIIKILIIVTVSFIVSAGPKQIYLVVVGANIMSNAFTGPLYNSLTFMSYLTCILNPFIYLFKYDEFQRGVKVVICRRKLNNVAT